ncbi:hypothetical protein JHK82_043271 [Glycine max]|nr:hypothetical protein JHK82_043271 [Glycine max]
MEKYVEQPREWEMKRLEKKTPGTIHGATKGVENEKLFVTLTLSSHSRLRFFESFHLSLSLSRRTRDPRREKMEGTGVGTATGCYKCGKHVHWSRDCPFSAPNSNSNPNPNPNSNTTTTPNPNTPNTSSSSFNPNPPPKSPRSLYILFVIFHSVDSGSLKGFPKCFNVALSQVEERNVATDNLIPMELELKIASKIRAKERFDVYIVTNLARR